MVSRRPGIQIDGLAEARRAMRAAAPTANRIINEELRDVAGMVVQRAQDIVPVRSGRLRASLRPFAAGNRVGVRSSLPYANVIHWGGSVGRNDRTRIRASLFVQRAIQGQETVIVNRLSDAMERALDRIAGQ